MADNDCGRTRSGKPITDNLIEELARKAKEGFDVDEILRRRGGRDRVRIDSTGAVRVAQVVVR